MPSGGDGFYYFSVYLLVGDRKYATCNMQINGDVICTAQTDQEDTPSNEGVAVCNAASFATEGR